MTQHLAFYKRSAETLRMPAKNCSQCNVSPSGRSISRPGALQTPLASIVITNRDYGQYVGDAIDGCLAQDWPNLEVIVVDDCSQDHSWHVISTYSHRVRAVRQAHGGQLAAAVCGFRMTQGEVVIFLDSDDALDAGAVGQIVRRFAAGPAVAMVSYRLRLMDGAGRSLRGTVPCVRYRLSEGDLSRRILSCGPGNLVRPPTSGIAYRRDALVTALEHLDTRNDPFIIDDYLCAVVPLLGRISAIQNTLGSYRLHGRNRSRRVEAVPQSLRRARDKASATAIAVRRFIHRRGLSVPDTEWVRPWLMALEFGERKLASASFRLASCSLIGLYLRGLRSCLSAPADGVARKLAYLSWFTAMLLCPKVFVRPLAVRLLVPGGGNPAHSADD
jgi:glycosyltransferase involved in cell wall biosynthesis